jgi:hypothetical protein
VKKLTDLWLKPLEWLEALLNKAVLDSYEVYDVDKKEWVKGPSLDSIDPVTEPFRYANAQQDVALFGFISYFLLLILLLAVAAIVVVAL